MTSLHTTATDPSLPGAPGDSAGSSPPPAETGPPAAAVPMCSIATAAEPGAAASGVPVGVVGAVGSMGAPRQGGTAWQDTVRHDTVPRPRSRSDAEAPPVPRAVGPEDHGPPTGGDPTTARLRAAFADRLRAAHARGRSVAELADACRRPVAEIWALLGADAGAQGDADVQAGNGPAAPDFSGGIAAAAPDTLDGPDRGGADAGFVRQLPAAAPSDVSRSGAAPRPVREEPRILGYRRPSPSRRLRRMHPQAAQNGQGATARETAASGPTGAGLPGAAGRAGERAGAEELAAQGPSFGAGQDALGFAAVDAVTAAGPGTGTSWSNPPLGILIGGSPGPAEPLGRPEERAPVRVAARPIKVGRGTCLVVLPSWRPAIAVSVPTEQLLSATGLGSEQLVGARLTVLMNPAALHDRELELHGWEPAPAGPAGRTRRGGRA
ncbi:hypothetical protein ACGF13_30800 [Kitasatospora sp. NPDC048286]|uniref:hypothetical protein n=1 Tax=Kitasatospora sp. NPDC048286 TaxID=3364047 RepID=UPI003720666A